MIAEAKASIFKLNAYLIATQDLESTSVKAYLIGSKWYLTIREEYETWTLVPTEATTKFIGNKWVYRLKY